MQKRKIAKETFIARQRRFSFYTIKCRTNS